MNSTFFFRAVRRNTTHLNTTQPQFPPTVPSPQNPLPSPPLLTQRVNPLPCFSIRNPNPFPFSSPQKQPPFDRHGPMHKSRAYPRETSISRPVTPVRKSPLFQRARPGVCISRLHLFLPGTERGHGMACVNWIVRRVASFARFIYGLSF